MANVAELNALHGKGVELRDRLAQAHTAASPDDLRRIARSTLLDLLGARQELASPILEVLEQLVPPRAGANAEASLAAIQQQLERTYNGATIQQALSFARGFLGLNAELASALPAAVWPQAPSASAISGPAASTPTHVPSPSTPGLATLNQSLILLVAVGSVGVISFLAIRNANGPASTPANRPPNNATPPAAAPAVPASPPAPRPVATTPAADAGALFDAGVAVGGQRVLVDTGTISATANAGRVRFRYWLGHQSIDAMADCNRQTWTTYPEAETHSPQSAATARMLGRVCDGSTMAEPARSTAGAGLVFDPPSNIRTTPNGAILCSVTSRGAIPIQGREGDWYRTDFCGTPGYIHRGQVRF